MLGKQDKQEKREKKERDDQEPSSIAFYLLRLLTLTQNKTKF